MNVSLNGVSMNEEEMQKAMDEYAEVTNQYIDEVAAEKKVSFQCANLIVYLRSRARWTQEKEDELVAIDHAGDPLPRLWEV